MLLMQFLIVYILLEDVIQDSGLENFILAYRVPVFPGQRLCIKLRPDEVSLLHSLARLFQGWQKLTGFLREVWSKCTCT